MNKQLKALKSKHHKVYVWATRNDGTKYAAAVIHNVADLESKYVQKDIKRALNDPSTYKLEFCKIRICSDGVSREVGKPLYTYTKAVGA